ncbi:hypothetical protein ACFL2V_20750 [Pseudomonadota bacterium]
MILTASFLTAGAALLGASSIANYRVKNHKQKALNQGLEAISELRKLLEYAPQHRGLANAYLNGNQSFRNDMEIIAKNIDAVITSFQESHPSLTNDRDLSNHWQNIVQRWHPLKTTVWNLESPESFKQHTALIIDIRFMMQDVAEHCGLTRLGCNKTRELLLTLVNRVPNMIEFVGQARGMGMGAISKGQLLTAVRVKLLFLEDNIADALDATSSAIRGGEISPALVEDSRHLTDGFVKLINTQLLDKENITINPTDYYDAGTASISANLKLLEELTLAISKNISK